VTLNDFRLASQGPFTGTEPVRLFIHTYTRAATHVPGVDAAFVIEAKPGHLTGIDRQIYFHIDCQPGEPLDLIVDVGIMPRRLSEPLAGLLQGGGGIVDLEDPARPNIVFPGAPHSQARIGSAIDHELAQMVELPQTHLTPGFSIAPNAGLITGGPSIVPAGKANYQFHATFQYGDQVSGGPEGSISGCRTPGSIPEAYIIEGLRDQQTRRLLYDTSDPNGEGYTRAEDRACHADPNEHGEDEARAPHDLPSRPRYRRHECGPPVAPHFGQIPRAGPPATISPPVGESPTNPSPKPPPLAPLTVALDAGYDHTTPGGSFGPSTVCADITAGAAAANGTFTATLVPPGRSTSGTLDGAGKARVVFGIPSPGHYDIKVDVTAAGRSGSADAALDVPAPDATHMQSKTCAAPPAPV
jgi:hypothetical protein